MKIEERRYITINKNDYIYIFMAYKNKLIFQEKNYKNFLTKFFNKSLFYIIKYNFR